MSRTSQAQLWLHRSLLIALFALLGLGLWAVRAQAANDCAHRGDLDVMFCDDDENLVADLPADHSKWQNPDVLFFSYTPVEDPAIYVNMFKPFLQHLEKVTGKRVRYFTAQSYAAQIEAMRSGRLHIAGISTGPTAFAVNLAGYVPFALMGTEKGQFGYKLQVIVPADSKIQKLQDLKGHTVAHTEESSNSGNQAPRALFPAHGITPGQDYKIVYSGGHDRSVLGVAHGDYEAATIASEVMERMFDRNVVKRSAIRVIWESDPFPTTSFGEVYNLDPTLALKIRKAFFTYQFKGTALGKEFTAVDRFIPITYKQHWAVIRQIQKHNGIKYTREGVK
ncbi:MAG TPA: phosphate/phosphite/phosphonate ABC transporter substrate-binding protein [bacterium]|nr:phosphate/phosphite/phosphonate ABC transporter substrate-binding protein [bacterium]